LSLHGAWRLPAGFPAGTEGRQQARFRLQTLEKEQGGRLGEGGREGHEVPTYQVPAAVLRAPATSGPVRRRGRAGAQRARAGRGYVAAPLRKGAGAGRAGAGRRCAAAEPPSWPTGAGDGVIEANGRRPSPEAAERDCCARVAVLRRRTGRPAEARAVQVAGTSWKSLVE